MIIAAILLIKYWISTNDLVQNIEVRSTKKKRFMMYGVLSAIFLILHSIFLGINFEYDLYKFFRRFVLLAFIIFEIVAQTLLVVTLFKIKNIISDIINKKILLFKIILVSILIFTALASLPLLTSSGNVHFKHALEWNYFIGVVLFYLLTFFFWKSQKNQKFKSSNTFVLELLNLVRRCSRYRRTRHPAMLSATMRSFPPYKLEPLGFSLSGRLRVAS